MSSRTKFDGRPCGACGAKTRPKFEPGRGKGTRLQHSKFWVCENGHQVVRKRGQAA